MVAQVVEKLPVLADALLQPGALSRGKGGHVLVAFRALRLAHEGHCNGKAVPEKLPTRAPQSAATGPAYRGYLDFSTARIQSGMVKWVAQTYRSLFSRARQAIVMRVAASVAESTSSTSSPTCNLKAVNPSS